MPITPTDREWHAQWLSELLADLANDAGKLEAVLTDLAYQATRVPSAGNTDHISLACRSVREIQQFAGQAGLALMVRAARDADLAQSQEIDAVLRDVAAQPSGDRAKLAAPARVVRP